MANRNTNIVDLLLSALDKTQLENFIRKECSNDKQFQDRFLALGAGRFFKPDPANYASRVEDLISDYSDRYGFIQYRDTFDFNHAVTQILDEADEAMENGQWETAVAVLTGISSVAEDIINSGDDSAGELGDIVNGCFEKWHDLCTNQSLSEELKSGIYELALSKFNDKDLKGWDWWWDWIQMAIELADTPDKQSRVIKALEAIQPHGDDWTAKYHAETAQKYKLEMMSRCGSEEDQIKFMYDNVSNPDFRKRLIKMAWDKADFDEVLRLAKDGASHDAGYAGLVDDWRKWEYKVYQEIGDKDNELRLARYFFFEGGNWNEKEFYMESMYSALKSLVNPNEWSDFVTTLIAEAEEKKEIGRLLHIYTEEKMWEEYMDYIRRSPSIPIIDDAPKEVKKLFKDELIKLYASDIRNFFRYASNRNAYSQGVELLRQLIKYGGSEEAGLIVSEQKSRTPRRPALIDELSKL